MASLGYFSEHDCSKWSTERLQRRLEEIESQLAAWNAKQQIEEDPGELSCERGEITTELLRRGKLPAGSAAGLEGAREKFQQLLAASSTPPERARVKIPEPVEIGGHLSHPMATRVPHDPPAYFPSDLWPQTYVILLQAQRKFPLRNQTLEFCKCVVAEMTPIFVEEVKAEKMKTGAVLREHGGGIQDLLHSLLVHNDDGIKSGFSRLSNQAYRLGEKVRQSNEWLQLAKAIADVESARVQNGGKTAQTAESKATNRAAAWQEVEITFLSDHRVEICCGANNRKTYNYGELGFQDRRSGKSQEPKPASAWVILCELAKQNGTVPRPTAGKTRSTMQKRIEEIREKLRSHFGIEADPIPFNGISYQTSFKIGCGPSFNT